MKNRMNLVFTLGRPFSPLYSALMKMREKMYASRIFRQHRLSVPVVSVGNLVLGGTGKTPTVRHIAEMFHRRGLKVAIISRGYRGEAKQKVNIVADGKQVLLSAAQAGDESRMLAELLPGVIVLTGTKRVDPCRYAIQKYGVDVIILDDGFQHLSVARDLDVVLFDATTLAGNSRVFPGGPLREPVSALKRCNCFLITSLTEFNQDRARMFSDILKQRFPKKPVFFSPVVAESHSISSEDSSENFKDDAVFAFCGIGNPSRFEDSLGSIGITPRGFTAFNDHASYNQADIHNINKLAIESGAQKLITTEKDYVKIKDLHSDLPLHVLKIRQKIDHSFDEFVLRQLHMKN